jgi:hypothetical protein
MADIGRNLFVLLDEGTIEGHEQLKSYITSYDKGLFGAPEEGNFLFDETRTNDIPQVSQAENDFLTSLYTEEEVRKVAFQMEHNKALVLIAFQLNFIRIYGMSSSLTCWLFSRIFMLDGWSCLGSTLVKLSYCQRLMKMKGSNNTVIFIFLTSALKYSLRWPQSG